MYVGKFSCLIAVLFALVGCTTPETLTREPELPQLTETRSALLDLPPPTRRLEVAVYKFEDATGQFKTADTFQTLSKAVSQGGASVLVKALQDAGDRRWFTVVERTSLTNLLQERKIIRDLRQRYLGEKIVNPKALPPMLFAGIILEGGVVGYDSNTITGGAGARLLGIGGKAEYRHDTISVNLRAVSVKTGEVLTSVVVQKSIISAGITASAFKYIDFDQVLELEGGITTNEPGLIALTKAIEKAVYTLIMEGVSTGLWEFSPDSDDGIDLVNAYLLDQGRDPIASKVEEKASVEKPKPAPAKSKETKLKKPEPKPADVKKEAAAKPVPQPIAVEPEQTPQAASAPLPVDAKEETSAAPVPADEDVPLRSEPIADQPKALKQNTIAMAIQDEVLPPSLRVFYVATHQNSLRNHQRA